MTKHTVILGDKKVELPEAPTFQEALSKAGLNPNHWAEDGERNFGTKPPAAVQLAFETSNKVAIALIKPNPYQPEGRINPPADVVERIAKSIKEHGLLQTPVARQRPDGSYQMGDGWIRLCGYRRLMEQEGTEWGFMPVIIRELSDKQMADLVMEANTVRHDLSAIDLAKFYKKYLEDLKVGQAELARLHNVSQGEISNTIRLLELPEEVQQKVISHEISETHARTLLQLEEKLQDKKEVSRLVNRIVKDHATVADIDRDIKARLWDSTVSLGESQYGYENPAFDTTGCKSCEHYRMLQYPWSTLEGKKPRCADKKCWKEKQEAALQANNKELLEKLTQQGIKNLTEYDYKTMEFLNGEFSECKTCEKRAACKDKYSREQFRIVCTDKKCYETKEKAKHAADAHARAMEEKKYELVVEKVFNRLVPDSVTTLQTTIECLLECNDSDKPAVNFIKAFDLFELKLDEDGEVDGDITNEKIMAAIRTEADKQMLQRMIPRLAFEICRGGYVGRTDQKRLLNAFKGVAQRTADEGGSTDGEEEDEE